MTFWEQFWPQLIATLVGAVFGIPAGIGLERWITRRTEKERRKRVITSITRELSQNRTSLIEWKGKEGDYERGILAEELSIETWRAISEGGELKLIENPLLLHSLSNTYFQIRSLQGLSNKFFDLSITGGRKVPLSTLTKIVEEIYERVENMIPDIRIQIALLDSLRKV